MHPKYLSSLPRGLIVLGLLPLTCLAANDVIVFHNGDQLTGEIKSLERGKLSFKHDATGTIDIEWNNVAFLSSDQNIQAETVNGTRYFGRLSLAEEDAEVVVETHRGPIVLERDHVVKMNPIDQESWRDVDLSVSFGYNFANANSVTNLNMGVSASQRTRTRIVSAVYSSVVSDSENNPISQNQSLALNFSRLRADRWLTSGNLTFESNDELNLNLRTSLGSGAGRILAQTDHSFFVLEGGLKVTRENLVGEPEDVDSLESYAKFEWDWYRYDTPELDWSANFELIPSVTEWGRIRAQTNISLKWEIYKDLDWKMEFYDSYDNEPQSAGASNNDYGVNSTLSYDF